MPLCCINKHVNAPGTLWCTTCESLVAGVRIDDYSIVSYIRRGSSSVVYLAGQHSLNNRKVVLKVFQSINSHASVKDFQREAALLASLEHPYILPIYAYGIIRERKLEAAPYTPYLVLPYAGQGSLHEAFLREGSRPWPLNRVLPVIEEAAAALSYAHERGVLHRDVKPGNLLLMGSHVMLSDFGVSSLIDAQESHVSIRMAGSPAFMAPEVWECHPGRYSDQYALAITCFYLLVGDYPWPYAASTNVNMHAWSHLHRHIAPRTLHACRPDLPMEVSVVLQRAMAKDPHERYPSISAFAADLKTATLDTTLNVSWEVLRSQPIPPAVAAPVVPSQATNMRQAPIWPETERLNNVQLPVTPTPEPATSVRYKDRWIKPALVLNVLICTVFAIMAYALHHDLASTTLLLRALLPALIIGPCAALCFRRIVPASNTKGILYGVWFGCLDTLLSAPACILWETLWRTFAYWGNAWKIAGDGLSFFLLEGGKLLVVAPVMALVCLGFTILGGAIIGLFATSTP